MCDVKQDVIVNGKPFVWCECSGLDPNAVLEIDDWLKNWYLRNKPQIKCHSGILTTRFKHIA